MKAKRQAIAIFIALTLIAVNAFALADPAPPENASTEVFCEVEPYYLFTLPLPATVFYPDTRKLLGDFRVDDLLLEAGAWLTIELARGTMAKTDDPSRTLAYLAEADFPASIGFSDIGDGYDVAVLIDPAAFAAALPGQYRATLTFRVRLQPLGAVVWEGTTVVVAEKAAPPTHTPTPTRTPGGGGVLTASPSPGTTLKPPVTGGDELFARYGGIMAALAAVILAGLWLFAALRYSVVPRAVLVVRGADACTIVWGYANRRGRRCEVAPDQSRLSALRGEILGDAEGPYAFEKGEVDDAFRTSVAPGSVVEWRVKHRRAVVDVDKHAE